MKSSRRKCLERLGLTETQSSASPTHWMQPVAAMFPLSPHPTNLLEKCFIYPNLEGRLPSQQAARRQMVRSIVSQRSSTYDNTAHLPYTPYSMLQAVLSQPIFGWAPLQAGRFSRKYSYDAFPPAPKSRCYPHTTLLDHSLTRITGSSGYASFFCLRYPFTRLAIFLRRSSCHRGNPTNGSIPGSRLTSLANHPKECKESGMRRKIGSQK